MVFVKYIRALQQWYKRSDTIDQILLEEVDESNEWLIIITMDKSSSDDAFDNFVFEDNDLIWNVVSQLIDVEEPRFFYYRSKFNL